MHRKKYSILLITPEDRQHTVVFSRYLIYIVTAFCLVLSALAAFGIIKLMNWDNDSRQLSELKEFRIRALEIIRDLDGSDLLQDSTRLVESFKTHFAQNPELIPVTPPVDGYVTQTMCLDDSNPHYGVDIAAKAVDLIRAPADGLVIVSGLYQGLGNTLILAHARGFYTVFGHNDTNLVRQREWVTMNQPIARVGKFGDTEGPHLHFELWKNDRVIDPRDFIEEYKQRDVSIR